MAIWQLCANLLIPNCLRSNLSYSPLAALVLYVNVDRTKKSYLEKIIKALDSDIEIVKMHKDNLDYGYIY